MASSRSITRGGGHTRTLTIAEKGPTAGPTSPNRTVSGTAGQRIKRLELKGSDTLFPPEAPRRRGGVGRSGRWAKNLDGALLGL